MGKTAKEVKARRHQAIIVSKFSRYKEEGYYAYPKRPHRGLTSNNELWGVSRGHSRYTRKYWRTEWYV